jgi:cell wall assembly regulator SMI1
MTNGADEIQMQSFHDGAPPPPPITHSWKKIDRWLEKNYEELWDNLCEGCTINDVNELEHELDCSLPLDVRESLQLHDGQERGGRPTGVIFGCMLLDCEEIVQEWKNWRTVNEEFLSTSSTTIPDEPQPPMKAYGGASSSTASPPPPVPPQAGNPLWRQELLDKQDSQPPRAIQKAYAHPSWIPLARDWGGNNIAVDLAPGPAGKWGQVIIFGRDFDCKYVIARSWSAFLAILADDINSGKVLVDEDSGDMTLKQFKDASPPYLQILRWRVDQKHGRKPPKRRPANGLGVNTGVNGRSGRESPYGSSSPNLEERGRSPHRFPTRGPNASPMAPKGVSSPLARVTEEPNSVRTSIGNLPKAGNLLDVSTPVEVVKADLPVENTPKSPDQNKPEKAKRDSAATATPRTSTGLDVVDGMKNVAI